jgi:RNA binding exosome subunit
MKICDAALSSRLSILYIDIRVFAHATEDLDKVSKAVRNLLPAGLAETVAFKKESLTGHHGNPIVSFETRIKDRELAQAFFEKLSSGMSLLDKESLGNKITQHMEKGNLYVRLDKQSASLNEVKLSTSDPIHLRIHFKKHRLEDILDACRKIGLLP